jgi:serine protease Do
MPVKDLLFLVEQIRDHGRPRFGAIGLLVQSLTPNMAGELQLPDSSGAIVADVVSGSPAEAAGMKIGEVIKSYNDIKIPSHRELIRAIGEYPIGKTVQLGVWSAGTMKTVSMQVREFEHNFWQSYESNTVQEPRFSKISDFGMELSEMSPELRKEHSINPKFAGPVVSKVVKEGAADNANFSAGDVVQRVGLAEVRTVADFSYIADAEARFDPHRRSSVRLALCAGCRECRPQPQTRAAEAS